MKQFLILVGAFFTLIASPVFADVIEAKETGFKIVQNYEIKTKSNKLFKQLIMPKNWWSSNHTWSQNAKNLYIEPYANGCFCEKLINNGSVMHMKIVYFAPNKEIRMFGALGPMQFSGASGHLILKITEKQDFTNLEVTFYGGGYYFGGLDKLAPMADKMLSEQFSNFKKHSENNK